MGHRDHHPQRSMKRRTSLPASKRGPRAFKPAEIIVVDGGSADATMRGGKPAPIGCSWRRAGRGHRRQNAGGGLQSW